MTHPVETTAPSGYEPGTEAPRQQAEKVGVWEDFIDIFHVPSQVFARRERGSVWIPILVVTALIGTFFVLNAGAYESIMEAEFRRSIEAAGPGAPQMTPEMIEGARGMTTWMARISVFVGMPITMLLVGVTLWLVGKFFDAKQTLHAALVVAAYAYVPKVVEAILVSVQSLLIDTSSLTGRFQLSWGAGRFVDPDASPLLLALVGRLDVFTIWVTVLLAIGLAVTGRIPRARAAIAAAIVWVIGALPQVIPALRG